MNSSLASVLTAAGFWWHWPVMPWPAGCTCNVTPDPPIAHWGTISHLQTLPALRGRGIGSALMVWAKAGRPAGDGPGATALGRAGRHGTGGFYARLGWREIGRWPKALRLAPDDDRDEILMLLTPL